MSCFGEVSNWLSSTNETIANPEAFRIRWGLDIIAFDNGTREDLASIVKTWGVARQLIDSYTLAMSIAFGCTLLMKAYSEYITKRAGSKNKSKQGASLFSWKGLTHPWLLKPPDKIFVLHFFGMVCMYVHWELGAGVCESTRKISTLFYVWCLGSQFHATSYYMLLIKKIVASSVNMAGTVKTSKIDVVFGVIFPWLSTIIVLLDMFGVLPIRNYLDTFKILLVMYFLPALHNGLSIALFGKRAVETLDVALSASGGPAGGGKTAQLAAVKHRVTFISLWVFGSSLTVCNIELVLAFSTLMTTPLVNVVVIVYFCSVLSLYMTFGLLLELKHIKESKQGSSSKVGTTDVTNGTSTGTSVAASEHRLQSTNVNVSENNAAS